MGSGVGVHDPNDLEGLSEQARMELKKEVIKQLQSQQISALISSDRLASADVDEIVQSDPTLLEIFMARHEAVRSKLKDLVDPVLRRLKGQT